MLLVSLWLVLLPHATFAEDLKWKPVGPAPTTGGQVEGPGRQTVVGAVNDVAPHPSDANILYAGTVNGGIWRTRNATADEPHWESLTDQQSSLSIGALEFDPTDAMHSTLVAGMRRSSSLYDMGGKLNGLLLTSDGGDTWTSDNGGGVLAGLNITGLAPRGEVIVVAATLGETDKSGIFRRASRAGPWTQVSGKPGSGLPAGVSFDLVGHPGDPAVLYTALLDVNTGGAGIYRSTDTGATWTKISDAAFGEILGWGTDNVEIAVGPGGNVFVAVVNGGQLAGVFLSPTGEAPWIALDVPQTIEVGGTVGIHPGGQGRTHLSLAAHPLLPRIAYVGGDRQPMRDEMNQTQPYWPNAVGASNFTGRLFRIDAAEPRGSQASPLTHVGTAHNSAPHADSRDMAFDAAGTLIEADDGGVYRRTSPSDASGDWHSMNGDLHVTEFSSVVWDSVAKVAVGGAQDTGSPEGASKTHAQWRSVLQGDGGVVAVDDTSTPGRSWRYGSFPQLGGFHRRQFDASNMQKEWMWLSVPDSLSGDFITPIELNQADPRRIVVGARNDIYESIDRGTTLVPLGAGVSVNSANDVYHPLAYGASDDRNALYAGVGNRVWVRKGSGQIRASAALAGAQLIAAIALDPRNSKRAFAIDNRAVYRTTNAGGTWSKVTGNLASMTAGQLRTIVFITVGEGLAGGLDADAIAVGAENGVYIAKGPAFNTWQPFGLGLPKAAIMRLDFDATDRILLAGTLGRGAWTLNLARAPAQTISLSSEVLFEYNSADLRPAADAELSSVVRQVGELSPAPSKVEVEGHTDSVGSDSYNLRLSEDRARNTGARLVALGMAGNLIRTRGYGEQRPLESNATEAGRARNRRVEIRIVP